MNSFLQTWAKVKNVKGQTEESFQRQLVIEFSPESKQVIDFETEFRHQLQYREMMYLQKAIASIQRTLHKLFWPTSEQPPKTEYLVTMIESLWHETEATLITFFRLDLEDDADDALQI